MTDQVGNPPATRIVDAFGGDAARLTKLEGGEGTSWRAGDLALKPTDPDERIGWLGAALARVPDTDDFRVARPVPAADGSWIVDGWSATSWVDGVHVSGRWEDSLRVSGAFHAALGRVDADPLPSADDPWSFAMRVAWGEQPAPRDHPDVDSLLDELSPLLEQSWKGSPAQIIHGDLGGNVVYADGLPRPSSTCHHTSLPHRSPTRSSSPTGSPGTVRPSTSRPDSPRPMRKALNSSRERPCSA